MGISERVCQANVLRDNFVHSVSGSSLQKVKRRVK